MESLSAVKRALVPRPEQRLAPGKDRSAQFIAKVRRQAQLEGRSFLKLVPAEFRDLVINEAEKAFDAKGAGRTMEEFIEVMAEKWLAQREAFETLSREDGYRPVNRASSLNAVGIFALTARGSVIALDQPSGAIGERGIWYDRIKVREDKKIPQCSYGLLMQQARVGDRLYTSVFISSAIIALAAKEGASREAVKKSFIDMTMTLNTIGEEVFVRRV